MADVTSPVSRSLSSLQAGRAIAAILVVLFHNSVSIFASSKYWDKNPVGSLFDFGDSGVFFFFVLSGFIILHAHYEDLNKPSRMRSYAWKRFRRIYPIYWIILLAVLPAYFLVKSFGYRFETQPEVILSSFLLVHLMSLNAVMIVSWTLFHEVMFYLFFAVAIWRLQYGFVLLGAWFVLSALSIGRDHTSLLAGFYFSHLHLLFGFGMFAAWGMKRWSLPLPWLAVLLGSGVFLIAGADEAYWHWIALDLRTLIFGFGATLGIVGLVEMERGGRLRVPRWLRLLGDASYSIYLTHYFILSLIAKLAWASGVARLLPTIVAYIALACLAVAGGVSCHLWVERPLLAQLGQKPRRSSPHHA